MTYKINDYFGDKVLLQPRVELYSVTDFMGKEMPGLAVVLDEIDEQGEIGEQYAVLTVSFGEFIGAKNCAYIDTNNCYFAKQLLEQGIAVDTSFTKSSGFCTYPLWRFSDEFLSECGGDNYKEYADAYDKYMNPCDDSEEECDEDEDEGMVQKW